MNGNSQSEFLMVMAVQPENTVPPLWVRYWLTVIVWLIVIVWGTP